MIPELIRAIMRFVPDYFTWDEKQQEEYRVHMPEEDEFAIRQLLMSELLGITVANDSEMDEAESHLTNAQCPMDYNKWGNVTLAGYWRGLLLS